jgi:hypothetical protein
MLLPPREEPYLLQAVYDLVVYGLCEEIVLDWGDNHLVVQIERDFDTLKTEFHDESFVPAKAARASKSRFVLSRQRAAVLRALAEAPRGELPIQQLALTAGLSPSTTMNAVYDMRTIVSYCTSVKQPFTGKGWAGKREVVGITPDGRAALASPESQPYRNLSTCSPWNRFRGKECDWTWVGVNKQGYRDLIVLSFDILMPQVLFHAIASSIEVLTISQQRGKKSELNGGASC